MTMTTASPRARHNGRVDESDPAARPRRRSFTAEYKAAIVDEYDQFPVGAPERGALLRRDSVSALRGGLSTRFSVSSLQRCAWPPTTAFRAGGRGRVDAVRCRSRAGRPRAAVG